MMTFGIYFVQIFLNCVNPAASFGEYVEKKLETGLSIAIKIKSDKSFITISSKSILLFRKL